MDRLDGVVQPYAWGDRHTIAEIQGRSPGDGPEAELWLGAHPKAPSRLAGADRTLDEVVAAQPGVVLGPAVASRFGAFPFLLKILAAAEPLSIQAHPGLARARAGFVRENDAGIPLDSPQRTYRDDNHKPELICALTDFEAKCGFRPLATTRDLIAVITAAAQPTAATPSADTQPAGPPGEAQPGGASLAELARRLGTADGRYGEAGEGDDLDADDEAAVLGAVVSWLLRLGPEEAHALVAETVDAAERALSPGHRYERELAWTIELDTCHPGDVGVMVALLLNHVVLAPGEAMFLDAGNLHAYLRGAGVELMANSDNVVRGGLTVKHVDAEELLAVVDVTTAPAPVQTPSGPDHRYDAPVPELGLTRLTGARRRLIEPLGPEIVLVTDGAVELVATTTPNATRLRVERGDAAFVAAADGPYELIPDGPTTAWRATVGDLDA